MLEVTLHVRSESRSVFLPVDLLIHRVIILWNHNSCGTLFLDDLLASKLRKQTCVGAVASDTLFLVFAGRNFVMCSESNVALCTCHNEL